MTNEKAWTVRAEIDLNLKRAYDEVLSTEVPERFRILLAQLREKEAEA